MINSESQLFDIVSEYSSGFPKLYLILFGESEQNCGFKFERGFLGSLGTYLKNHKEPNDSVILKTKKGYTAKEIGNIIEKCKNEEKQLIVFFSGHGDNGILSLFNDQTIDIGAFSSTNNNNTILFTSSCKPFVKKNKRRNMIVIGERRGLRYPHKPKKLYGVYADLNRPSNDYEDEEICFNVKDY
jgi:hypothetical protein